MTVKNVVTVANCYLQLFKVLCFVSTWIFTLNIQLSPAEYGITLHDIICLWCQSWCQWKCDDRTLINNESSTRIFFFFLCWLFFLVSQQAHSTEREWERAVHALTPNENGTKIHHNKQTSKGPRPHQIWMKKHSMKCTVAHSEKNGEKLIFMITEQFQSRLIYFITISIQEWWLNFHYIHVANYVLWVKQFFFTIAKFRFNYFREKPKRNIVNSMKWSSFFFLGRIL